jgi:hypothetical protein
LKQPDITVPSALGPLARASLVPLTVRMKWNYTNFIHSFEFRQSCKNRNKSLIQLHFIDFYRHFERIARHRRALLRTSSSSHRSAAGASIAMVFWHNLAPLRPPENPS